DVESGNTVRVRNNFPIRITKVYWHVIFSLAWVGRVIRWSEIVAGLSNKEGLRTVWTHGDW
ncbi:MAG: hypothetical protein V3S26_08600, partial [Acidimicrobiia bacterium]